MQVRTTDTTHFDLYEDRSQWKCLLRVKLRRTQCEHTFPLRFRIRTLLAAVSTWRSKTLEKSPVAAKAGSTTKITDTLAPTDFANANGCATPRSASFDPSVGMRICRYMLHLPIVWTHHCLPNAKLGPGFRMQSCDHSIGPSCCEPDALVNRKHWCGCAPEQSPQACLYLGGMILCTSRLSQSCA
jgi:hypothetical protein